MSKKADKESVFLTTKVRTKLKGDGSWLQRRSEAQDETNKEKPWLAEVRAGRLNGEPLETSPPSSPTTSTPPALNSDAQRTPSSGYPVSVSTKLECPTPSPTSNGASQTATQFPKKPSGSYKKIAPYAVRPTAEIQEAQLSSEEQEKRTEAASSVLMKSAGRQRSYVLSAAKKYESQDKPPETSLANDSPAFVAKRVEIVDDDKSAATPAPASNPPTSPAAPATSVASAPEPKPASVADAEPVALKVGEVAPAPVKEDPPPGSAAVEDPFEDKQPGSTKVAAPLPVVIPECFQAVPAQPEPKASAIRVNTPLVDLAPAAPSPTSPTAAARGPSTPVPLTPTPVSTVTTQAKPELVEKPASKPRSQDKPPETSLANDSPAFVAKRVEIVDDDKSAATPAPASNPPTSPAAPATSVASAPEPKPASVADAEPVALKVGEVAPAPVKEDPPPGSAAVEDPFEDKQPGSTKVAAPLPVVIPECFQAVPAQPEPKASAIRVNTPLVDLAPAAPSPTSPTAAARGPSTPVPLTPTPVSTVTTQAKPELVEKPASKPSSSVDTLTDLSNTLITFNSSSTSVVEAAPALAEEEAGSANSHTTQIGDEEEPAPELSSRKPLTDDLLAFTDGPVESGAEPVPPSAGRWSQDLLSGLNSLSTRPEEKQTDETARETQRPTETVTITTKTVIITDKSREDDADPWSSQRQSTVTESSSADPFDPYPIGTTSSNSSSDLLQPDSDISSSSARTQRSWASTWETSPPPQADTEESREASPADQMVDQETLVRFERKSSENDSPWDKWTSPTLYTLPGAEEEEEEEEEESTAYTQTETVTTTITTIREGSDERHVTDRYQTYSRSTTEEDQRVVTPEPEAKRGFVYLKEYVNATEVSLHNARDTPDGGSDYVTSSSTSHSYSSPSTYSSGLPSSDCNFCGEPVGNDAKITIEHLNINCHPRCFKCGVCKKPMGDLLDSMFLHGGKVHCEICYNEA